MFHLFSDIIGNKSKWKKNQYYRNVLRYVICTTKVIKNTLECAFWSGRTEYNYNILISLGMEYNVFEKFGLKIFFNLEFSK